MTAIGVSGKEAGFIIAADGRRRVDDISRAAAPDKAKAREDSDAQKIFPLCSDDKQIAYALAGYVANDEIPFDAVTQHIQNPREIRSLEDSERYVKGYVEACSSDLALSMDEPYCKKIGGRIHVAAITPSEGFQWRIRPQ